MKSALRLSGAKFFPEAAILHEKGNLHVKFSIDVDVTEIPSDNQGFRPTNYKTNRNPVYFGDIRRRDNVRDYANARRIALELAGGTTRTPEETEEPDDGEPFFVKRAGRNDDRRYPLV